MNLIYESQIVNNVNEINFISAYPNIICKLYKNGELHFNDDCIGELFCDIMKITKQHISDFIGNINFNSYSWIKKFYDGQLEKLKSHLWLYRNIVINRFYGILASIDHPGNFICDHPSLIAEYLRNFWDSIEKNFETNICYLDTDEIYYRSDKDFKIEDFLEKFDQIELPYERNSMRKNIEGSLFDNIINSKLPDDVIAKIINESRKMKLGNILNDEQRYSDSFICYFKSVKQYLVFNNNMELLRMCGIRTKK